MSTSEEAGTSWVFGRALTAFGAIAWVLFIVYASTEPLDSDDWSRLWLLTFVLVPPAVLFARFGIVGAIGVVFDSLFEGWLGKLLWAVVVFALFFS